MLQEGWGTLGCRLIQATSQKTQGGGAAGRGGHRQTFSVDKACLGEVHQTEHGPLAGHQPHRPGQGRFLGKGVVKFLSLESLGLFALGQRRQPQSLDQGSQFLAGGHMGQGQIRAG